MNECAYKLCISKMGNIIISKTQYLQEIFEPCVGWQIVFSTEPMYWEDQNIKYYILGWWGMYKFVVFAHTLDNHN